MERKGYSAVLLALTAVFIWGINSAVGKLLLNDLEPMQMIFASSIGGVFIMLMINISPLRNENTQKLDRGIRDIVKIVIIGAFGNFLYYCLYYAGMARLAAQQAYLINYMWPATTVILSTVILGEQIRAVTVISFLGSLLGVAFVAFQGELALGSIDLIGVLYCLGAAFSYGIYNNLMKKYPYDLNISNLIHSLSAVLFSAVVLLFEDRFPHINSAFISCFLLYGVLNLGLAYLLWGKALRSGKTAFISNLAYLTPCISMISIAVILGERISIWSIVGLVCILVSVALQIVLSAFNKAKRKHS